MKKLMTGNEALVQGAWEAGVLFASAYPGTPSTEILENMAERPEVVSEWAPNEKVAMEAAIGASIAGARSMAAMKHVGVNVAADALFTFVYTGVNGGMVLISADEPGQHSSQNEQDNRNYARFAKMPMLEPSTSQEARDMMKQAFEISEEFDTPVLLRMTTRTCHSKGIVECGDRREAAPRPYVKDVKKYVTVPANARGLRANLELRLKRLAEASDASPLNYVENPGKKVGVISSGMAYTFAQEVFGEQASYLKLGFSYPYPLEKLRAFCREVETVYVIEENDPLIEEAVRLLGFDCRGKDTFPAFGEMTPDVIRSAVFGETRPVLEPDCSAVVDRPPTLCAGCPHRGLFYELGKRKNIMVSGDIGCYTLGFAPPYNAMDFNICMGASISAGHGAQQAFDRMGSEMRVVSVLGDSTFFHTGINSLMEVLYNNSRTVNIILDNRTTGMTGHQDNPGSGRRADRSPAPAMDIEAICRALGARNVVTIDPNDLKKVRETLNWALSLDEPSVIITRWPCVLKPMSPEDLEEFDHPFRDKCFVNQDKCIACKLCLRSGCPALVFDKPEQHMSIDRLTCVGCQVCAQICPKQAIEKEER